jgi:hypothetical protein
MIITIKGKRGEGKSLLAMQIIKKDSFVMLVENDLKSNFRLSKLTNKTKYIIIDDVVNYNKIYNIFKAKTLRINIQFQESFVIEMPNIIIIKASL